MRFLILQIRGGMRCGNKTKNQNGNPGEMTKFAVPSLSEEVLKTEAESSPFVANSPELVGFDEANLLLKRDLCELFLTIQYILHIGVSSKKVLKKFPKGALSLQTKFHLNVKIKKFSQECFRTIFHFYRAYLHEFQFSELLLFSTDQHNRHTEYPIISVL